MKLLLTSGGVTTEGIRTALVELLGKPIEACSALCIPSAQWGHPRCTPTTAFNFVRGAAPGSLTGLGWQRVGLLELTAMPDIAPERWTGWVEEALRALGGSASILDIARHVWTDHEAEIRAAGDLLYEWQYELRWAGDLLRREGASLSFAGRYV